MQYPKTPAPQWDHHAIYKKETDPQFSHFELDAYLSGWGHCLEVKKVELIKQWIREKCEAGEQQIEHCEEMTRLRKNPLSPWPNDFQEFYPYG